MGLPELTNEERKYYREVWGFDTITDLVDLPEGGKGYQATFALDISGVRLRVEVIYPDYKPFARIILEDGTTRTHSILEQIYDREEPAQFWEWNSELFYEFFPKLYELDKYLEHSPFNRVHEKKAAFLFAACSHIAQTIAGCGLKKFLFSTIGSYFENLTRLHSGLWFILDEIPLPELKQMQQDFIIKLLEDVSEEWLISNWEWISPAFSIPSKIFPTEKDAWFPLFSPTLQKKVLSVVIKVAPNYYYSEMARPGVKVTPLGCDDYIYGYKYEKRYQLGNGAEIKVLMECNENPESHIFLNDGGSFPPIDLINTTYSDIYNEIDMVMHGITVMVEFALMCAFGEEIAQINREDLCATAKSYRDETRNIKDKKIFQGDLFFASLKRIAPQEFSKLEERTRELPLKLKNNQDLPADIYWLMKGGMYYDTKKIPEAVEAYQRGMLYLMEHSKEGGQTGYALWTYLGTTFFDLKLYGEAYYCWSKLNFHRDKFIKSYVKELQDKCVLARIPPLLKPKNEDTESNPKVINLPPTGSTSDREQRLLALFSSLTPLKDRARFLGEILALEIPDKNESIDTISALEYAISARWDGNIDDNFHGYYRNPEISLQVVMEDPVCPRPERLEEIPPRSEEKWHLRMVFEEDWPLTPEQEEALDERESYGYEHNGPPRITYELDVSRFLDVHRETKWTFWVD